MTRIKTLCIAALAAVALLAVAPAAHAQEGREPVTITGGKIGTDKRFGIGLQGGTVSGLSLKYFLNQSQALQVGIGGSPWGVGLNLEYLVHPWVLVDQAAVAVPIYLGAGVGLGQYYHYGYNGLNVHVPIGLSIEFRDIPIDLFVQLEPGVGFGNGYFGFYIGGTSGIRFYF